MKVFEQLGISHQLLANIKQQGIETPTQIQEESIPHIMNGKDVIGESATGSGKTLAFGCGIIDTAVPRKGIQTIILSPTRELAEQVKDSIRQLATGKKLNVIAIYGGVSIEPQIQELRRAEVVVATPGRLLDHLSRRTINTSNVNILVLDEADRMLEMGFIEDVEQIIRACPRNRQTLVFSATLAPRIKDLANKYMNNPVKISARNQVDPSKLKQVYYNIQKNMKLSLLMHLLQSEKEGLAMVFCNTRKTTDFVYQNLKANKINAIAIHGGLTQSKRTKTIGMFNQAKAGVLVCTDVAARGLHIDNVSHIFNYEIPKDSNDYVHRIGRTARAGEKGKAVNLLCDYDHDNFSRILRDYREFNVENIKSPFLKQVAAIRVDDRSRSDNRRRPQVRSGFRPRRGAGRHGGYGGQSRSGQRFRRDR
ncbi:ATP-dependent RNA helicase [Candidatus Woesearchaeota archaeon]|nr:ATP-dependent RNA helicase [Candidatus Woesearchaeota archaeon]